ncbi:MAG: Uma2 family endonuclease [Deltaproteobacteria bacterium]|nr:Uma2 family endonuclease [Deltaproteobacteria bacterium]
MVQAAKISATYQDVLDSPEGVIAELMSGELHLQPRPAKPHTYAATVLGADLVAAFHRGKGGPGGWWIQFEPELHLGPDVLVPDLAGWRRESTPTFDLTVAYYTERPDWVCEVLSPATARRDRFQKLDLYHQAGVPWAWLVDPDAQSIEVFQHEQGGWLRVQTASGDAIAALRPFDAVPTELGALWVPQP